MPDFSGAAELTPRPGEVAPQPPPNPQMVDLAAAMGQARAQAVAAAQQQLAEKAMAEHRAKEPTFATPELLERWRVIQALEKSNEARIQGLSRMAGGGSFPLVSLLELRLACIIDVMFPMETKRGQEVRLDIDQRFHMKLADIIKNNEDALRQQILASGAQLPPGAIEAMGEMQGFEIPEAERIRRKQIREQQAADLAALNAGADAAQNHGREITG